MASLPQSDSAQPANSPTAELSTTNEVPTTTPASTQSSPAVDYKQEVRFAVVMYGGVSLAIYINGVAQEML